ncbi:MAG: SPFH domain-containing protein [Planctomycetales bacterium]|nr:SPFH domain-containing protein [Planctomycetales bacterium]
MATIGRFLFWRHLRSEPSSHVIQFRRGTAVRSGRGLAFWFTPLSASLYEIPCDDRDQPFLFHGRSSDFQDVTAQGVLTYRVSDPALLAKRVDFSLDLRTGVWLKTPLEQLSQLLTQLAQQHAWDYLAHTPVRQLLAEGVDQVRTRIREALLADEGLKGLGLEIVSVRVSGVAPTADLEKALQAPTREAIQQTADEATFQRRALAVEKERAIQENELKNQIELAKRKEGLIAQEGSNAQRQAREQAESQKIAAEAAAARDRLEAETRAAGLRAVDAARLEAEERRAGIYKNLPGDVLLGLAAQELAGKLQKLEHVSVTPELLAPVLARLADAGARRLEREEPGAGGKSSKKG